MKKHECQMMIELAKMNNTFQLMKEELRLEKKITKKKDRKERYDRLLTALENGKAFGIIAEAVANKIYEPKTEDSKSESSKTKSSKNDK